MDRGVTQLAFHLREMWQQVKVFQFFLILSGSFLVIASCKPCSSNWMLESAEGGGCQVYGDDHQFIFQDVIPDDSGAGSDAGISEGHISNQKVCPDQRSFCFLSTLPCLFPAENNPKVAVLGVSRIQFQSGATSYVGSTGAAEEQSGRNLSAGYGIFKLSNGHAVSCSLHQRNYVGEFSSTPVAGGNEYDLSSCSGSLRIQKKTNFVLNNIRGVSRFNSFGVSSSVGVEISTPVLDWGQNYIYSHSVACLTVANTCNSSFLHVYEPFSSNNQFFPCNYSDIVLKPGEEASVCFVFLPRWLGLSLAHLILQTSSGGFLVQAKGSAIESPYRIQPLASIDVPSSGKVSKNLSLFNPFDDSLYVEEVNAWVSISAGNITQFAEALCTVKQSHSWKQYSLLSAGDWLAVKSNLVGFPSIAMKPWNNWEIYSHAGENIMEMDLSFETEGKVLGAFLIKLHKSSQEKYILTVPLEVNMERKPSYDDHGIPLSLSLEALEPYDGNGSVVAISLTNRGPSILNVIKISEARDSNIFCIKCMEGLLLFPGTSTSVAVISCSALPAEVSGSPYIDKKCKITVLTNNSVTPQVTVPCKDIIHVCLKTEKVSSVGYSRQSEWDKQGNMRIRSLSHDMQLTSWNKVLGSREADEYVLHNWKSLGTASGITLLDDTQLQFPMVSTGSNHSEWITVRNPTKHSVVMQLILNSAEVVDECRGQDASVYNIYSRNSAYNGFSSPTKYGFSIAENALKEAYVHPYSQASLGPIIFQPSGRCRWSSSVLIRNNISGIEWLSIQGLGGTSSLVLFEDSEPIIHDLEFNLNSPVPSAVSLLDFFLKVEETTYACSQQILKELIAQNTGDLPVEVSSIGISGAGCHLGGFMVHSCKGFSLQPGESTRLLISYQSDFSVAIVRRDLELALTTGSLAIPMKAAVPVHMLNICKRSLIWMRLKKFFVILLVGSILILIFCLIFPQVVAFGTQDLSKTGRRAFVRISDRGKSSHLLCNDGNNKFSSPSETGSLVRTISEENLVKQVSNGRHANGEYEPTISGFVARDAKLRLQNDKPMASSDTPRESSSFPLLSKSSAGINHDLVEALVVPGVVETSVNLSVRTGKEKVKRRRKRKGMAAGSVDVSSSQSGNSTPSSPLSPASSVTPNRARSGSPDTGRFVEARNPFSQSAPWTSTTTVPEQKLTVHKQSSVHGTSVRKPTLLPSATFPSAGRVSSSALGSSPLASASTVAPHARAPGSKLCDPKAFKQEEKMKLRDEYTYDIWGDHFCGLNLNGRPKDDVACKSSGAESESFFVSGPQTFVTKSQSRSVSYLYQDG